MLGEDAPPAAASAVHAGDDQDDDASFAESMIVSPDLAPRRPRRTGLWTTLSLLAAAGLLVQAVHAWRDTLVTQPYWQDALPRIYGAFGIELVPAWNIRQWCIERSDALASDAALDVESVFSNRGDRPLPPPELKVRIVDAYSDTLAGAVIAPRDYLAGTVPERIEPGRRITAVARLDYNEPRLDGYEVSLCYPGPNGTLRCGTGCPADD